MENRENVEDGICIVSFDGGGPGSMSQLRMLEEFMARLAFESDVEVDELRPADYFDLMGGVGFGGFVALLLGRLRMTTSQAMEELTTIGSETFPKGDEKAIKEGTMARLRAAIESMLERNGHSVDMKLRDTSDNRCKVVLFAAATEVMDHCHPFRTYRSPRKSLQCTFVDAACATMANPEYFSSVSIGPRLRKQNFAGIPRNFHNPMREVLKEAKLTFGEKTPVSLMLSLGAGQPARHSSLDHQVTRRSLIHCDGVARDLQDQLHGFAEYLRLNVDKGMENIELNNWHKLGSIETYTTVYLEMNQITRFIDRAVQLLLQRNGSVTLGNLSGTSADCGVKFHSESLEKYLAMEFKQMQDVIQGLGIEKVTLVDAIGNDIPIPKHFCPTYAMLLDVIGVYFRHQRPPGSDLVERGDYRLLHGSGRSIMDPVEWDQLEKVRVKVEMSMILRTRNNDKARCPRCRTRSEAPPTNGWATCASCSGQFQIEDQYKSQSGDGVHAKENSIVIPAVKESVKASQGRSPTEGNKKIAEEGEPKFRLISVFNILDTLSDDSLASADLTPIHALTRDSASSELDFLEASGLVPLFDPSDAQSWYLLGRAYMTSQEYIKAHEAYQQAVYRDGSNPALWISIGILYLQINQFKDALDAYSRAIRFNPYVSVVWFDLGILYETCNQQLGDAMDAYVRAKELDPTNVTVKERLELLNKHTQDPSIPLGPAPPSKDVHPTAYSNLQRHLHNPQHSQGASSSSSYI